MISLRLCTAAAFVSAAAAVFTAAPASAQSPFIGELRDFGFSFCPPNWLPANGELLQISEYTALFSLYGTIYGGNGVNTFGVPDLQGRAGIGAGTGPGLPHYEQGQKVGQTFFKLSTVPSHNHGATTAPELIGKLESATTNTPGAGVAVAITASGEDIYRAGSPNVSLSSATATATTTISGGGAEPPAQVDTRGPYVATNWCVAVDGIYPEHP